MLISTGFLVDSYPDNTSYLMIRGAPNAQVDSKMSSLIHFRGELTDSETKHLKKAVTDAEEAGLTGVPKNEDVIGEPWIITAHSTGAMDMYVASRVGLSKVFTAKSVPALAESIRQSPYSE